MITIGYGDILPKTDGEMIFAIFAMIISCGVYAYCFNEVGNIVNEYTKKNNELK